MMDATTPLVDDAARHTAMTAHDRSLLVEAGAGSGKTAVMAGRIALMLARGIKPGSIAAITFTELAASELLTRVREFVDELIAGKIAPELRIALPAGIDAEEAAQLRAARDALDEITCSTIHGFCQRLIKPYPAEAGIDPGATVMDRSQSDLIFPELVDAWLHERLSDEAPGILAELVRHDPGNTVKTIHEIAEHLRKRPDLQTPPAVALDQSIAAFRDASKGFAEFLRTSELMEEKTREIVTRLESFAQQLGDERADRDLRAVDLLGLPHDPVLWTQNGSFRTYRHKGRWEAAAAGAGQSRAKGRSLNDTASGHYEKCVSLLGKLLGDAATHVMSQLTEQTRDTVRRYQTCKRAAAQLDFDDLILSARNLLRDHEAVRRALGERFSRVLVDEFQDTDPLQTEILWRLCSEPTEGGSDWRKLRIRPGALFVVGDPKQAIYRFRGADVSAYVSARDAFKRQDPESLLSIATNFRSQSAIVNYVNDRFRIPLSEPGQPGFTHLIPFHKQGEGPGIVALDVHIEGEAETASAEEQRDAEAETVAALCARLIGHHRVLDRKTGERRACLPGDIALLAPTGTELWRFEEALEKHGIPVATQAGKGLFRRQEIQDLIALTRTLADSRDRLALGALLRGPLIGVTEEQLLDVLLEIPPDANAEPGRLPRLDLRIDASLISKPLVRETITTLQSLWRRGNSTTPHALLSEAIDELRVRPLLLQRHGSQAERALANVDLYLTLASAYATRGLRAFAEAMTLAWSDEARAVEGRPDAQEESVALLTKHASKGLEWPIVIPINSLTKTLHSGGVMIDRGTGRLYCPIFGVDPHGYDEVRAYEKEEVTRERIRLWYVAATRARELLILPRHNVAASSAAWASLVDLGRTDLPAMASDALPVERVRDEGPSVNVQTREIYAAQALAIASARRPLKWQAPSRDERSAGDDLDKVNEGGERQPPDADESPIWASGPDDATPTDAGIEATVRGGRERGLILHKLMEEVLNEETEPAAHALEARAAELVAQLGRPSAAEAAEGLFAPELADCVARTLALPQIATIRPALKAEFALYSSDVSGDAEIATAGVADAVMLDEHGRPELIIDWKSDVNPQTSTLEHYRNQVQDYLAMTGASRGLIVLMTAGSVIEVSPSSSVS
jgi:ATP-dependent exoDNAse (exonuclease V) beta subunit